MDLSEIDFEKLEGPLSFKFDCGTRGEFQNAFLRERAWQEQLLGLSVTYIMHVKDAPKGFITLCMDAIPLAKSEKPDGVNYPDLPALKIGQMACDKSLLRGYGELLIDFAILKALELQELVGCRYVTLDAVRPLEKWYVDKGFLRNEKDQGDREAKQLDKRKREEMPVSMRLDLFRLDLRPDSSLATEPSPTPIKPA